MKILTVILLGGLLSACGGGSQTTAYNNVVSGSTELTASVHLRSGWLDQKLMDYGSSFRIGLDSEQDVTNPYSELGTYAISATSWSPLPEELVKLRYISLGYTNGYEFKGSRWEGFVAEHPTWIERTCAAGHPIAWMPGYPETSPLPLDWTNPAVLSWVEQTMLAPYLREGMGGVMLDQVLPNNWAGFCGHFSASGAWVQQYSGKENDPVYAKMVGAIEVELVHWIHEQGPTDVLAINTHPSAEYMSEVEQYASNADITIDESGITNYGSDVSTRQLQEALELGQFVNAHGGCYWQEDKYTGAPDRTADDAAYLIDWSPCEILSIFPAGSHTATLAYPELKENYGLPEGGPLYSDGVWTRKFTGAVVTFDTLTDQGSIKTY